MDDVVDLGDGTPCPSTQHMFEVDDNIGNEFVDNQTLYCSTPTTTKGVWGGGFSLAKSMYDTTAWKLILMRCISVEGIRARMPIK